jgi:hypothetical protein
MEKWNERASLRQIQCREYRRGLRQLYSPRILLNHDFGIRIDVKGLGSQGQSTLQGFKESKIFGHVVILSPNRFRNSDSAVLGTIHHHPDTRRARIPQRAAIYVGYEI